MYLGPVKQRVMQLSSMKSWLSTMKPFCVVCGKGEVHELSIHRSSAHSALLCCGGPLAHSVGEKVSLHQRINGEILSGRDLVKIFSLILDWGINCDDSSSRIYSQVILTKSEPCLPMFSCCINHNLMKSKQKVDRNCKEGEKLNIQGEQITDQTSSYYSILYRTVK